MAVYKHTYKITPARGLRRGRAFSSSTRFGFARVYQSKFLLLFIIGCLFYPLVCAAYIYLSHNAPFLARSTSRRRSCRTMDGRFFYFYSIVQGALAYLLTAFVGPSAGFAGFCQRRHAALFQPAIFARRIRGGEDHRPAASAFADHLDSRRGAFCDSGQHRRVGLDEANLLAGGFHCPRICSSGLSSSR